MDNIGGYRIPFVYRLIRIKYMENKKVGEHFYLKRSKACLPIFIISKKLLPITIS